MNRITLLFLVISLGCTQQPNNEVKSGKISDDMSQQVALSPKIFAINQDSLKTFTLGKKGYRKPIIQKADHSNKVLFRGPRAIIPGKSFLLQSKDDAIVGKEPIKSKLPIITQIEGVPTKNTPGTGGFAKPVEIKIVNPVKINLDSIKEFKKRIIKNNKYTIQHGDTILPPLQVMAQHLPSSLVKAPGIRDNAVIDARYLDLDHGLIQSQVSDVVEASNGDIWLSYRGSGLSRYNGVSLKHFGLDQGLNSLVINKMIKDGNGNIWIATRTNGVGKYDGLYFTWYTTDQGLPDNQVITMLEKSNGDIIFGTINGISVFDGKDLVNYSAKQGLLAENLRFFSEDERENIWIPAVNLTRFDGNSFYIYSQKAILAAGPVSAALEDNKGNLWFGTFDSGIYLMRRDSLINFATPQGFSNAFITSIVEDKKGNIWIATYGEGIFKYDGVSFINYNTDHGLRNNKVFNITEDSGGKLWLAADGDGVSIFNPNSFTHFTTEQGLINIWASKIIEDENKNLWFASWGSGLYKFDGEYYTNYTKKEGLLYDWVGEIIIDQDKNIWAPTEFGVSGLSMFDQKTFTNYFMHDIIPGIRFTSAERGANGDLWFGTFQNGILKFSNQSGVAKFTHFDQPFLKKGFISDLFLDKDENLWIGTFGNGLFIFNGSEFKNYNIDNGLAGNQVTSFSEDELGNLRIGTTDGLSIFNGSSFKNITIKNGLAHNYIKTVVDDRNGNHWVSTNGGLSLLSKNYSKLHNFVLEDGLKGMDFKSHSGLLDSSNRLWWGTGKAITMLNLNTFELPTGIPRIKINEILINQKHYDYRQIEEHIKDSLGINYTEVPAFSNIPKDLILNHTNNTLTFQYAGIDWQAPHQLKYQYKLAGQDDKWIVLTKENRVTYRNLPHGTFTFKVKAIGGANKWSDTLEYSFVINPPWWLTWWARTGYGLLIIFLIVAIIRLRTKVLRIQKEQLEEEVEKRTLELKNTQAQLIQSEKMASLGQLTAGIAHEINNPVSFAQTSSFALDQDLKEIMQLIEKYRRFIQNSKDDSTEIEDFEKTIDYKFVLEAINQSIADIKEGTKRTAEIVKGLREFSYQDHAEMELADIHKGIDATLELFKSRFPDNVNIIKNYDHSIGMINCNLGQLNQVFLNLLTNAIDAIGDKGEIEITTKKQAGKVIISFMDNGRGISREIIDKVFDPFFTTKKVGDGTGLGLSISYGIIEKHGGVIEVQSDPAEGTRFDIILPIG